MQRPEGNNKFSTQLPIDLYRHILADLQDHETITTSYGLDEVTHIIESRMSEWEKTKKSLYGAQNYLNYLRIRLLYFSYLSKINEEETTIAELLTLDSSEYPNYAVKLFFEEAIQEYSLIKQPNYKDIEDMFRSMASQGLLSADDEYDLLVQKDLGLQGQEKIKNALDDNVDPAISQLRFWDEKVTLGLFAQRELLNRNIRFVYSIRKKLFWDLSDDMHREMILTGIEALNHAIVLFDPAKFKNRLTTYANQFISRGMQRKYYELNNIRTVHSTRIALLTVFKDLQDVTRVYHDNENRPPTIEEIVRYFGKKYTPVGYTSIIRKMLRGEIVFEDFVGDLGALPDENNGEKENELFDEEVISRMRAEVRDAMNITVDYDHGGKRPVFSEGELRLINEYITSLENLQPLPTTGAIGISWGKSQQLVAQKKINIENKLLSDPRLEKADYLRKLFNVTKNPFEVLTSQGKKDVRIYPPLSTEQIENLKTEIILLIKINYLPTNVAEKNAVELITNLSEYFKIHYNDTAFNLQDFAKYYKNAVGIQDANRGIFTRIQTYAPYCLNVLRLHYMPEYDRYLNALIILGKGPREINKIKKRDQDGNED